MGESAGAGSIMFHLLAQGGKQPVPFKRAVVQSIPLTVSVDPAQQESSFQKFLNILNVTSLEEARQLPSSALIAANVQQTGAEPYDEFAFGPAVDDVYIPGPPAKLLLEGAFAKGIPLLSSHTAFEVPPAIHGSDLVYTFYDGAADVDPHVASTMQHAIAGFVKCGEPDAGPLGFAFPRYGKQATTVNLDINSSVTISDPMWNNRTLWLAQTSWIG
ncbi:Alpha/Beta hydrolase protein [Trichoderma compactum]